MNLKINTLKKLDYKLFATLLLFGFLPLLYQTIRIHFIGNLPSDWGFNIASQISWLNTLFEIIQETILLPIFYIMGKSLNNEKEFENKIKTGLLIILATYMIFSILIIIFIKPLLLFMDQSPKLIEASATYIKIESIASILYIMVQFLILILLTLKKEKYLLIVLITQMVLTIASDSVLISDLPFSLNIGVNGIAFGNIIVNLILLVVIYFLLKQSSINILPTGKLDFKWTREWFKIGSYSGIESLIRNTAFMFMVLKMVNAVGEQGTFWVANNFIWGWLLLPITQLGQVIKRDCGEFGNKAIIDRTAPYFMLTTLICLLWIITIPLWKPFLLYVMNISNYNQVFYIAIISLSFYILFAYNNVIDSIFYGIGKTNYMLFQSIVINSLFYGILFVLYKLGIYIPSLNKIALMFAIGIGADSILTMFIFKWMLKKQNIKLD